MTTLLADTSVLMKWFQPQREAEITAARALRDATVSGDIDVRILDLAVYEFGNVLLRRLRFPADDVAEQIADLLVIVNAPIAFEPHWASRAASLGERFNLTFYDGAWAAAGQELGMPLVSADHQLLDVGLAESAIEAAARFGLTV